MNSSNKTDKKKRLLGLSWIPYVLILFEMLYMATPFAVFFYSIYEFPLKFLNTHSGTAQLLQTVFPHFVETDSLLIGSLMYAGWIFMIVGFFVFLTAFIQIYYAKFKKKGAVTGGLYRIIRHPQYTAWTLFGLGMSLLWSRVIVWLMFITMTFIYYILAKVEEKECSQKFPDTYIPYMSKTGMFFPRIKIFKDIEIFKQRIPQKVILPVIYCLMMFGSVFLSIHLRNYSISKMASTSGDNFAAVSLNYIDIQTVKAGTDIVLSDNDVKKEISKRFSPSDKMILYIMPQNWSVSELGMPNIQDSSMVNSDNPHMRPGSHGNPEDTEPMKKRVLISLAKLVRPSESDRILHNLKQQIPKLYVDIDLRTRSVIKIITDLPKSIYGSIPVPVF
jgi:protein-S-isoprenylcysteine O-methyltransferase Ste14